MSFRFASVLFLAPLLVVGCAAEGGGDLGDMPYDPEPDDGGDFPPADSGDSCGDGIDGDADGRVDEGCMCGAGETQRCFLGDPAQAGVGACVWGEQGCVVGMEFGTWDRCAGFGRPGIGAFRTDAAPCRAGHRGGSHGGVLVARGDPRHGLRR